MKQYSFNFTKNGVIVYSVYLTNLFFVNLLTR